MGFDFERGRLDRSTHPFTTMAGDDDVRVTIRVVRARRRCRAIFATLHEGGHALYDQGFPRALHGTLLADGAEHGHPRVAGAALGEPRRPQPRRSGSTTSRSCAALFPDALAASTPRQCHRIDRTSCARALNRVEADEATYNLHILDALRARARAAQPATSRSATCRRRGTSAARTARRRAAERARGLPAGRALGARRASATSRPTRSATCTRRSSSRPTARRHDLDAQLRGGDLRSLRAWLAERVYATGCAEAPSPSSSA